MTRSAGVKSNAIAAAGGLGQVSGAANLDGKLPFFIQSGNLSMETANTGAGHYVAPCDLRIIGALLNVTEQLGTGAGTIAAGTMADPDGIVNDYSVATSVTAGTVVDLEADAAFTGAALFGTIIPKGTVIVFTTDGGATTTGEASLTLTAIPV